MLNFLLSTFYYSLLKNNLKKEHYSKKYLSVCSAAIFVIVSTLNKTFSYLTFLTIPSYDPIFVSLSPRCIWRECLVFFLLLKCLLHVCLSGSFISMRNRWHCVHWTKPIRGTDAASQNWLQKNLLNVPVAILDISTFSTKYSGSYKALVIYVKRSFCCLHWQYHIVQESTSG